MAASTGCWLCGWTHRTFSLTSLNATELAPASDYHVTAITSQLDVSLH